MEHNKLLYGTPIGMHTHVCGQLSQAAIDLAHERGMDLPTMGCGHAFSHDGAVNQHLPVVEYNALHMCPACGAGPWLAIHNSDGPYKRVSNKELIAAIDLAKAGDDELLIDTLIKMAMYELTRREA